MDIYATLRYPEVSFGNIFVNIQLLLFKINISFYILFQFCVKA